ncbi:putative RNA-directed DNA polymerase from transposon X-element [Araneus ventricosus]|uniref:Putative RNA-directed DNA polymerase from transposon X-element n=1 Tax=Araneus ventricosus TaxID=182803 RepID=A0A4Y2SV58_ARAVE|nr:putative RNA-directed DNA polymerase from transposon X-element [Araneus ventricosus]
MQKSRQCDSYAHALVADETESLSDDTPMVNPKIKPTIPKQSVPAVANNTSKIFTDIFTCVNTLLDEDWCNTPLLLKAFKNALPALHDATHGVDMAYILFEQYVVVRNKETVPPHTQSLKFNQHVNISNLQSLSVGFWNANGVRSRFAEVRDFVSEQNLDVFLVQETFLPPGFTPLIANYQVYCNDRINNNSRTHIFGGTCIYIKSTIEHHCVPTPELVSMDATIVEMKIGSHPPIKIISAYARVGMTDGFPLADLQKLLNYGPNVIIAGDLNAAHIAWNSPRTSFYGRKLFNYLQALTVSKVKNSLRSDHLPIILTLDTGSFPIYSPEQFSTNWENFRHILSFKPLPPCKITSNDDADNTVGCLSKILKEALAEAYTQKFKDPPEKLPLGIRDKIHHRNYFRRQWQRTRDPEFRREFYRIKDEIAVETKQHLLQKRAEQIESLTPESRTLWRRSKLLRKPFSPIPPLRGETGYPALAPIEKAEVLADSLRKQFEPNTDPIFDNPIVSGIVKEAVESFANTQHINNLSSVTATEVIDFIKTLKPNKSPGLDQISNRMLKNLPLKFILYLTFLMNVLMQNCYFPKCWKTAVVVPIPKPNSDLSLPQNYRPISLLSCVSKVFESVLLRRLNQFLDDNNIIISEQFGFRKKLSTNHQLV